jgi:uncharacterized protein (DUF433 family)
MQGFSCESRCILDYPHIVKTPDTCAGAARIDGTRITVKLIVAKVVRHRMLPEEVLMDHPHLTMAQIHSALAYYFDNKAEVDAAMRADEELAKEIRAKFPSRLASKLNLQA